MFIATVKISEKLQEEHSEDYDYKKVKSVQNMLNSSGFLM